MLKNILSPDFINAILRASTPILFATLASAIASKSGITNMALEGMLLFSALFGVIFSSLTHSFLGGLLITMVIGGLIGFFLAFFILQLKTDEILAAIALNLIATGGTVLLMLAVSGDAVLPPRSPAFRHRRSIFRWLRRSRSSEKSFPVRI